MVVRRGSHLPQQESLSGFEPRSQTDRLFFCLFPPAAVGEAIAVESDGLRAEHSLTGRSIETARLHLTLHHLGDHVDAREDIVQAASGAASRIDLAPFEIILSSASSFAGREGNHPCVLQGGEARQPVHALWRELSNQLMAAGLGRYLKREFTPHVTLLYDKRVLPAQSIDPISWTVRDFSLVRSLLGQSRHQLLGTWPLRGKGVDASG
ncbi:2'-5' RNA ligase [Pseudoxanthomonas gei]|uniref:RNA 2',3'-cyclic phosphodiesterase n=1 Tax=Pseudoxanthomonas gei TaxID=1383030 RepID=A0ABX0AF83_9GAMM|nr:2'-5' RNA ligase family protein [Pseudoxanthomonas gei]NDK40277.1 2'-5' RNA ligase [Pseudoxanthomonas gei]